MMPITIDDDDHDDDDHDDDDDDEDDDEDDDVVFLAGWGSFDASNFIWIIGWCILNLSTLFLCLSFSTRPPAQRDETDKRGRWSSYTGTVPGSRDASFRGSQRRFWSSCRPLLPAHCAAPRRINPIFLSLLLAMFPFRGWAQRKSIREGFWRLLGIFGR